MENFGYLECAIAQEGLALTRRNREVTHARRPNSHPTSHKISSDLVQPPVLTHSAQTPSQTNSQDHAKDNALPVEADQAFTWWGMV